jgi:Type-A lantibiotic
MSQSNEEKKAVQDSNRITINEQGEVIINDPGLASAVQELSDEELDEIAGGGNSGCNTGCKVYTK